MPTTMSNFRNDFPHDDMCRCFLASVAVVNTFSLSLCQVKLKAEMVDIAYPPIIQSGGKYDLKV